VHYGVDAVLFVARVVVAMKDAIDRRLHTPERRTTVQDRLLKWDGKQ
jgi:hypothetical protein